MRLLFVVARYASDVTGGAERHCRQFATRLAGTGHDVEVLTSRAASSTSWANHYPAGSSRQEGVTVHRLPTPGPRDEAYFDALSWRVLWSGRAAPPPIAEAWVRAQGPLLADLVPWLVERAATFDVVVFFTYLFFTTSAGLRAAAGRVPTVLHATAHDEKPFWLPVYDGVLRTPDAYAWSTEEERDLLRRRGAGGVPGDVVGVGVDLGAPARADQSRFRRAHGLGDRPYLLALGRVAEGKGSLDLASWFAAYKARRPGPLTLVFAGPAEVALDPHADVVTTGPLDAETCGDALDGAVALVQPSYFESFSMVLSEAWAARKPALVQRRCEVLAGQARRSGGALCFEGFAELGAAIDLLLDEPGLTRRLGDAGWRYVCENYAWDAVLGRYARLLESAAGSYGRRRAA